MTHRSPLTSKTLGLSRHLGLNPAHKGVNEKAGHLILHVVRTQRIDVRKSQRLLTAGCGNRISSFIMNVMPAVFVTFGLDAGRLVEKNRNKDKSVCKHYN